MCKVDNTVTSGDGWVQTASCCELKINNLELAEEQGNVANYFLPRSWCWNA